MTQFDEASIAKLKVVELKQELEKLNVDIPKGAKKADLAALLRSVTIEAVKEPENMEEVNDDLEGDVDDLEADLKAVTEEETASQEKNSEENENAESAIPSENTEEAAEKTNNEAVNGESEKSEDQSEKMEEGTDESKGDKAPAEASTDENAEPGAD